MTPLIPYTGWACVNCGERQATDGEPRVCCTNRMQIRVLVDDPDQQSLTVQTAAAEAA